MKIKKEYIILLSIIIAAYLYLILRNQDRTHYQLPTINNITASEITKVEVSKADTSFVLNKKGENWEIAPGEYPADTDKVEGILKTIEGLSVTALVSESKNFIRYDLGRDKSIHVIAWIGEKKARDFEIGKAATSFSHTFLKFGDDDRVYHARGNFRSKFDQSIEQLRDKTVLSFKQEEIRRIKITQGDSVIALSRNEIPLEVNASKEDETKSRPPEKVEVVWQTEDGRKADENKLSRLLTMLSNLNCEKYLDDRKKEDTKSPLCNIELLGNKEYSLSVFPKKDKDAKGYPAVSSENDYTFSLRESQADDLIKAPDDILKNSPKSEYPPE